MTICICDGNLLTIYQAKNSILMVEERHPTVSATDVCHKEVIMVVEIRRGLLENVAPEVS